MRNWIFIVVCVLAILIFGCIAPGEKTPLEKDIEACKNLSSCDFARNPGHGTGQLYSPVADCIKETAEKYNNSAICNNLDNSPASCEIKGVGNYTLANLKDWCLTLFFVYNRDNGSCNLIENPRLKSDCYSETKIMTLFDNNETQNTSSLVNEKVPVQFNASGCQDVENGSSDYMVDFNDCIKVYDKIFYVYPSWIYFYNNQCLGDVAVSVYSLDGQSIENYNISFNQTQCVASYPLAVGSLNYTLYENNSKRVFVNSSIVSSYSDWRSIQIISEKK
ncbi:MAG: hypothetical protein V1492_05460 [Candidatus Micrarchaeota archaeon]